MLSGLIRPGVSFSARDFAFGRRVTRAVGAFVYVIEREDSGHVKIGVSENPSARRLTLQTGSSTRLRLIHTVFAGQDAEAVEAETHRLLGRARMAGEWFDVSPETAIAAVYGSASRLGVPIGEDAYAEPPPSRPWWRFTNALMIAVVALVFLALWALVVP